MKHSAGPGIHPEFDTIRLSGKESMDQAPPLEERASACCERPVLRVKGGDTRALWDRIVTEEPLEIRVCVLVNGRWEVHPISVTMRTPGHDFELAVGFLFSEGLVHSRRDIHRLAYCPDAGPSRGNIIQVYLRSGKVPDLERLSRHVFTNSSCGICGKTSIEQVRAVCPAPITSSLQVRGELICQLPEVLKEHQRVFHSTGGLHAAALFDGKGRLRAVREDVGRHNALDKLIGSLILRDEDGSGGIVLVSGRAGFELVQKAVLARIPIFAAVGAPSSLAVDLAREVGMTLIGFLRNGRFNVYTGPERIIF